MSKINLEKMNANSVKSPKNFDALAKARNMDTLLKLTAVYNDGSDNHPKVLGTLEFFGGSKKWYGKVFAILDVRTPEGWVTILESSRTIGMDKTFELKGKILFACGVEGVMLCDFFGFFSDLNGIDRSKVTVV